ncbi:2-amino-4-hydroxy-6-hydroxymethyldihydropteridine diphosphokinase [Lysobacteraceae bacterium NML120232]|nr:2-amino-4-hydroxy-6-hydroxymethyldihydropteridine diphosphokinase [Xanthomonadaceae bacterium NML120232]PJK11030.1 2-amino-4-hydroxy-6-hydroxymethyldihydropteridine diphosphokinase [Xanthomonadaceae bacterium NML08-0793]
MTCHAFIGLGGNLGDAPATLQSGLAALADLPQTRLLAASGLYRTAPVGGIEQADFTNAVAWLETRLAATALLQALFAIERAHGRDRSRELRWGPRTLDLDLLLYGDEIIEVEGLIVPHPRMAERRFVLEPLLEIAPDIRIPGIGRADEALMRLC